MKLLTGSVLILSMSIVGCFSPDDADPLNGRKAPAVQEAPQPEVTAEGKQIECSTLRQQDYEQYTSSIEAHKQEKTKALAAQKNQFLKDTEQLTKSVKTQQTECQTKINKYANDIKVYKDKVTKTNLDTLTQQKSQCSKETAGLNSTVKQQKDQYQTKIDKYADDIKKYRAQLAKSNSSILADKATLQKQIKDCESAKKITDQQSFTGLLYNLNFKGANPKSLTFTEGVRSQYQIQTRLFIGKPNAITGFRILSKTPKGLTVKKSGTGSGKWILKWKPAINLEEGFEQIIRVIEIEPIVDKTKLSKSESALISKEDLSNKIMLIVNRTKAKPTIELTEMSDKINKGNSLNFSVAVTDPSATRKTPPNINIGFGGLSSGTTYRDLINGASLITARSGHLPQFTKGVWIFHYKLNTAIIDLDPSLKSKIENSKKQLEIQFQVTAQSQVSGQTVQTQNVLISMEVGTE